MPQQYDWRHIELPFVRGNTIQPQLAVSIADHAGKVIITYRTADFRRGRDESRPYIVANKRKVL